MMTCSKCGKEMEMMVGHARGTWIAALQIKVSWGEEIYPEMVEMIRASLGKYAPPEGETRVEFNFCYECYLDALMGVLEENCRRLT